MNIQAQVDCVKKDAQMFVDSMIDALEAKKKDIFHDLEKKANETLHLYWELNSVKRKVK